MVKFVSEHSINTKIPLTQTLSHKGRRNVPSLPLYPPLRGGQGEGLREGEIFSCFFMHNIIPSSSLLCRLRVQRRTPGCFGFLFPALFLLSDVVPDYKDSQWVLPTVRQFQAGLSSYLECEARMR